MPKQGDIVKPFGPPRRAIKTPKLSVAQLVRRSWPSRKASAKKVAVRKVTTMNLPKNNLFEEGTYAYRVTTYSKDNQHDHVVTVFMPDGIEFNARAKVLVDCSCSDHVYRFEYNLAKKAGNALLWRCNGEAPVEPLKVGCCKHAIAALTILNRRAKAGRLVRKSRKPGKLSFKRG